MDSLKKQVSRARWRLILQQFLAVATWSLFASLGVSLGAVLVDRCCWSLGLTDVRLAWLLGSACGVGLLTAAIWTYVTRPRVHDAALELDKRFNLRERVSSALSLETRELETLAGKALVEDAERRVKKLDVSDRFTIRMRATALLPVLPAVAACLLLLYLPPLQPQPAQASVDNVESVKKAKAELEKLPRKLETQRAEAKKQGLKEAEQLFQKLEESTRELAKGEKQDSKQILLKLNDLKDQLEKRQKQLGDPDKLKQQLSQTKETGQGPAEQFAKAMKNGDFQKAIEELKKLQEQLKDGKLDEAAKNDLQKQLQQMQQQMQKLADAHQEMTRQLEQKIAEMRQNGQNQQADQLQQQLDQMQQMNPQMQQMQQLAQQLQQCQQCMQQGNNQQAAQKLAQAQQMMQQMQQNMQEMQMLQEAMQQLEDARCQACQACQGQTPGQKQGNGQKQGQGQGQGKGMGNGLGQGSGAGRRPIEEEKTNNRDSTVSQKVGKGAAIVTGEGGISTMRGQSLEQVKAQIVSDRAQLSDPRTEQGVLPRRVRDHNQEYFDAMRKGETP